MDLEKCLKNNIHNRSESDIRKAINEWAPTPSTYTVLDYSCLFNTVDDTEEISDIEEEKEQKAEYLDSVSDEDKHHDDEFSDTDGDLVNEVRFLPNFFFEVKHTYETSHCFLKYYIFHISFITCRMPQKMDLNLYSL